MTFDLLSSRQVSTFPIFDTRCNIWCNKPFRFKLSANVFFSYDGYFCQEVQRSRNTFNMYFWKSFGIIRNTSIQFWRILHISFLPVSFHSMILRISLWKVKDLGGWIISTWYLVWPLPVCAITAIYHSTIGSEHY